MDKDNGRFNVLDLGMDDVFNPSEDYLEFAAAASVLFTVKACLLENDTPEMRLFDIRKRVDPVEFAQGPTSKYDNMYGFLRTAVITYGLDCKEDVPASVPIWKKLATYIWAEKVDLITSIRLKNAGSSRKSAPPPPESLEDES